MIHAVHLYCLTFVHFFVFLLTENGNSCGAYVNPWESQQVREEKRADVTRSSHHSMMVVDAAQNMYTVKPMTLETAIMNAALKVC